MDKKSLVVINGQKIVSNIHGNTMSVIKKFLVVNVSLHILCNVTQIVIYVELVFLN